MTVNIEANGTIVTVRCECGWACAGVRMDLTPLHQQVSTHLVHHREEVNP